MLTTRTTSETETEFTRSLYTVASGNLVVNSKPVNSDAKDGLYIVFFLLQLQGDYEVRITLVGVPLDGSPYNYVEALLVVLLPRRLSTY